MKTSFNNNGILAMLAWVLFCVIVTIIVIGFALAARSNPSAKIPIVAFDRVCFARIAAEVQTLDGGLRAGYLAFMAPSGRVDVEFVPATTPPEHLQVRVQALAGAHYCKAVILKSGEL